MSRFYEDLGHCPKCGKFCGNIQGTFNGLEQLIKVEGDCKTHGTVDLTGQSWSAEDFDYYEIEKSVK